MTTEASIFFEQFKDDLLDGIHTCAIGEIVKYDPVKNMADVNILPDEYLITSIPVCMPLSGGFLIRIPYKQGDKVVVVFSHGDIDNIIYEDKNNISPRKHDINDAIVIGGIGVYSGSFPGGNDLIIAKQDLTSKISLSSDGSINIVGPNGVTITGKNGTQNF